MIKETIITARCTLVQSAVLRSHIRLSVCLSVRPSLSLVECDQIGWNSSKIISPLVSLGCSLFADRNFRVYFNGNTQKFWPKVTHSHVDLSVGDSRSQIAAAWLQIAQRSQWRACNPVWNNHLSFEWCQCWSPTTSPSPKFGSICPQKIRNGWSDTLQVWFYGRVFRVRGSDGAISGYIKSKMAAGRHLG